MVELIAELIERGHAYAGRRRRVLRGRDRSPATGCWPASRSRSLRAGARVEVDEEAGQAVADRLRPVEAGQAGRAELGVAVGPGPARAGTPSAWSCRSTCSARTSTCTAAASTWPSPTTRTSGPRPSGVGRPFARRWAHSGMVVVEGGEKMSKSLGNTLSLLELLDAYDPRAFRLLVLQSHYRSPMTVGDATLAVGRRAASSGSTPSPGSSPAPGRRAPDAAALDRFRTAWTTTSTRPTRWPAAFDLVPRSPGRDGRASRTALAAAVFDIFEDALGLPLHGERRRVAARRPRPRRRPATRPGPPRTGPGPTRCAPSCRPTGWIVEDGPTGPQFADERIATSSGTRPCAGTGTVGRRTSSPAGTSATTPTVATSWPSRSGPCARRPGRPDPVTVTAHYLSPAGRRPGRHPDPDRQAGPDAS